MNLMELYSPTPEDYRTEKDDNSVYRLDEPRKRRSRLTLEKLNRLRIMNDSRKSEHEEKLENISGQYKPKSEGGVGGMGGGLGL